MAFVTSHDIYDALPIPNDALDKGGVEMLRAGVVDEELFVTARRAFPEPAPWGYVLADVTRRLATLYAAEGAVTEAKASAAIVAAFEESLRASPVGAKPVKKGRTAKSAPRTKAQPKPVARRKRARAKP